MEKYARIHREIKKEIVQKQKQKELWEKEKENISMWYDVESDKLEELMEEYAADDRFGEYLVDGAVLRCTGATTDKVCGITLNIGKGPDSVVNRVRTTLNVSENPASANGLVYATRKDTVKVTNVPPFRCNCSLIEGKRTELEKIETDKSCNQEGICKHFMSLSNEWDNMLFEGNGYLMMKDVNPMLPCGGVAIWNSPSVEGITMTSTLFCNGGGGLIYPETSGQKIMEKSMDVLRRYLRDGEFEEDKVELAIRFLAFNSNVGLPEYSSKIGNDYNRYDDYILGWCVYFNEETGVSINPEYMKAMMYEESRMGYDSSSVPTTNIKRDVMQALDVKNYNIYDYINIPMDRFEAKISIMVNEENVYKTIEYIWTRNHSEGMPGNPNDEKKNRCGGIIRTLFNTEKDGSGTCYQDGANGTYYLVLENVTPLMSVGMAADKLQDLLVKYNYNYALALEQYNRGNSAYAGDVEERVQKGNNFIGD